MRTRNISLFRLYGGVEITPVADRVVVLCEWTNASGIMGLRPVAGGSGSFWTASLSFPAAKQPLKCSYRNWSAVSPDVMQAPPGRQTL